MMVGVVLACGTVGARVPPAAASAASASAQIADAGSVVRSLVGAMKMNDGARIRALFAPQATQAYGDGRPRSGPAFFAWLESDIIARKGQVEQA